MSMGLSLPCTRTRGGLLVVMCKSLPPSSIIFFSNSLSVIPDIASPFLQHRFPDHLFDGGHSQSHFGQAAAPQRNHPVVGGLLLERECGRADQDEFAQFVVDLHYLVQANSALVAGLVAIAAALAFENMRVRNLILRVAGVQHGLLGDLHLFLAVRAN